MINCITVCKKPELNPDACTHCQPCEVCPECGASIDALWDSYGEPDEAYNRSIAKILIENCRGCRFVIMARIHDLVTEICA